METGFRLISNHPRNNFLHFEDGRRCTKIMLCCSAGMSTSLLVRKMVEAANERDLPVQIDAYGVSEFDMQFPQYQVVLLGPQVKYMLKTLSDKAASLNIPVQPIDTMDYGMQRGDNVLNYALSLIPAAH